MGPAQAAPGAIQKDWGIPAAANTNFLFQVRDPETPGDALRRCHPLQVCWDTKDSGFLSGGFLMVSNAVLNEESEHRNVLSN